MRNAPVAPGTYAHRARGRQHAAVAGHVVRLLLAVRPGWFTAYRRLAEDHPQYKTDHDLQAAHAVAPWLVVFDDHEVDNNWAGDPPEHPEGHSVRRRAAASRASYENRPLRRSSVPEGSHLQLYRTVRWGRLADFHLLDTRQ